MAIDHDSLRLLASHDNPLSLEHIKRITAPNGELAQFLKPFATRDFYHRTWDFDGVTVLDDGFWVPGTGAGATAFAISTTQTLGGSITGATGTTDNIGIGIFGAPIVRGDNIAIMRARFKISAITDMSFEIGFADVVTDKALPIVTDVDTPAVGNGGLNLAVVHMDTDQTLQTMAFVTEGSTAGQVVAKQNLGILTPTADTYMTIQVGIYGNHATCIVNDSRTYRKVTLDAIEGGTLIAPWLFFRTRTTTTRTVTIDYVELFGGRGA